MIEKIEEDLKSLQKRSEAQNSEINNLYLALSEIYDRKERILTGFRPKVNLLSLVRPEVIYQILEFVDTNSYLKFRLVNRKANEIVKITSPKKILQLNHQVEIMEADIEKIIQEYKQTAENETQLNQQLQEAQQQLNQLQKAHIVELKSLCCPTDPVFRVCQYLFILMNPTSQMQCQWKDAQKMLNQMDFLEQLQNLDLNGITENQLTKLASMDQLTIQQVLNCSLAAGGLFRFIKAITDLRRSKVYILKYQVETLKKQQNQKKNIIEALKKISNK